MNIVTNTAEEDKHPPTANINNEAVVENSDTNGASNSGLETSDLSPKDILKATISFRALVESDGRQLKRSGDYYMCRCPFHTDRTPSFNVYPNDAWAKCFGCDWKGDIFDYVMKRTGCGFSEAFTLLCNQGSLHGTKTKRSASPKVIHEEEFKFSERELKDIEHYTARFIHDAELTVTKAAVRKWSATTFVKLAQDRHLGWAGDALAFIYKTGIRIRRWPGYDDRWDVGRAYVWRADLLARSNDVYITEGEPDAITLVDAGFEETPGTAVVAIPGAGLFQQQWSPLFRNKTVTICYDADDAGYKGAAKVAEWLEPVAAHVFVTDLREVLK